MCILSTLSALNIIENHYYHIKCRMDSMHAHWESGTQAMLLKFSRNGKDKTAPWKSTCGQKYIASVVLRTTIKNEWEKRSLIFSVYLYWLLEGCIVTCNGLYRQAMLICDAFDFWWNHSMMKRIGLKINASMCISRWWYSGEHSCLPSSWPGFDSRPTQSFFYPKLFSESLIAKQIHFAKHISVFY